ncbi:hypothetical protein ET495_14280 [Xylanimonas allomyrinae]|uniref:Uncharacterized protein n=1 Tax=Xylanimonas allomyrinae TaxID=2509459 RepID=A0A4P6ERQ4_9MICO|nr:hypothetical protein [Xylanimonas allomyrinae]QAY64189.1 hypothetical protein ET495_14280 [Xylanimonas allomyrinae]
MGIRWASLWTVLGMGALALASLAGVLRGHPWAWIPFAVASAVALREVRWLQRHRRQAREARFDRPRR